MGGIAQATTGSGVILGLILTDLQVHRVNWSAAGTWLWIALFAAIDRCDWSYAYWGGQPLAQFGYCTAYCSPFPLICY